METNEKHILEEMGLSSAEAEVYLVLLDTGTTLAGQVIRKTGFHRGTTYQLLQRLIEKGVVSTVMVGKKRHFKPVAPDVFLDLLKNRQKEFTEILPKLKSKLNSSKEKQEISVYYGKKGIRAVMDGMLEELKRGGTYHDFGSSGLFLDVMEDYWYLWQKKKKLYRIKSQVTFNSDLKVKHPELLKGYYGEARFHPAAFASPTDTMIYNDTVVLFIWTSKPPVAILIKDKENARGYLNQFKLLWMHASR